MADVKIDIDRRHLVPDRNGERYPHLVHGRDSLAIFYNVKLGTAEIRAAMPNLASRYRRLSRLPLAKKRLLVNAAVRDWYRCWYLEPFKKPDAVPTEAQVLLAVRVAWPDHTGHREVARELMRGAGGRPRGAPRKSNAN